ncbi:hypothetical protein P7C70_g7345, partial [Phenoliferia sp. Uapishka_3]
MPSTPTLILGTANFGPEGGTPWYTHHTTQAASSLIEAWGSLSGARLDTASVYGITTEWGTGGSERLLKEVGAIDGRFVIDTKVNIFYLHAPDRATPFLHVLEQLDALYKEGKFAKLGLSNYSAAEVQEFYGFTPQSRSTQRISRKLLGTVSKRRVGIIPRTSQERNVVLRLLTTCDGNVDWRASEGIGGSSEVSAAWQSVRYNHSNAPLQKKIVTLTVYSTISTCTSFHPDSRKAAVFQGEWFKPEIFAAVRLLNGLAKATGIAPVELSLRWIAHHSALEASHGDSIIVGASSTKQLRETVDALKGGPLDEKTAEGFAEMWRVCASAAPTYYFVT